MATLVITSSLCIISANWAVTKDVKQTGRNMEGLRLKALSRAVAAPSQRRSSTHPESPRNKFIGTHVCWRRSYVCAGARFWGQDERRRIYRSLAFKAPPSAAVGLETNTESPSWPLIGCPGRWGQNLGPLDLLFFYIIPKTVCVGLTSHILKSSIWVYHLDKCESS